MPHISGLPVKRHAVEHDDEFKVRDNNRKDMERWVSDQNANGNRMFDDRTSDQNNIYRNANTFSNGYTRKSNENFTQTESVRKQYRKL